MLTKLHGTNMDTNTLQHWHIGYTWIGNCHTDSVHLYEQAAQQLGVTLLFDYEHVYANNGMPIAGCAVYIKDEDGIKHSELLDLVVGMIRDARNA